MSPRKVTRTVKRVGAAAQNALEVARFGGLDTGEQPSPFEVFHRTPVYRLRRYFADADKTGRPPIVFVPPMMLAAEVYDVSPAISAVATLHELGMDPWVVDFGAPEKEEGGLERTLTDHIVAVSEAIDQIKQATGQDVHLSGYSQGGMFCYQAAAYRQSRDMASIITFGSPVELHGMIPFGLGQLPIMQNAAGVAGPVIERIHLPAWLSRTGFKLLDPIKAARQQLDFMMQLHDREALLEKEGQRRFMARDGWVAWAGPALAELAEVVFAGNRMMQGGFVIEGRPLSLTDITCPVLCFVGDVDEIAPPPVVRALHRAAPRAEKFEVEMNAGHFGLVVGSKAMQTTWPTVSSFAHWKSGVGPEPENLSALQDPEADDGSQLHVRHGLQLAAEVTGDVAKSMVAGVGRTGRSVVSMADRALEQLPRLVRLERVRRDTKISLGLLLDEKARNNPEGTFFLFEDRAFSYAQTKQRIDNVVRGLVTMGVRQGEQVGVLMGTRPTALVVAAALNRLGAVAVLHRPDGSLANEVQLGRVKRIIADPEHVDIVKSAEVDVQVLMLGVTRDDEATPAGVVDMERIDVEGMGFPAWYDANPGRAEDLAFLLFTGRGDRTRANRITNRRFSLSAFGTASAAALSDADTVYGVSPTYHPSGLLTSMGGAIAGGARLAMARRFDASTFWDEVRRYGVTVVSYTWTQCLDLVNAPVDPAEHGHPVRLFIGSGMPKGVWSRVSRRFSPAGIVEFYASTEGAAVLANLSGRKPGCKGRPLPGSADVAIARYDLEEGRLVEGPDGFAIVCDDNEPGMLLSRVDRERGATPVGTLRGVFAKGDAWLATSDLFTRDEDGDYWLRDHVPALVRTADGFIATIPVEEDLGESAAVDLAVAYGLTVQDRRIVVAAVKVREGIQIDPADLAVHVARLERAERPSVIRIVDEIPLTTWFRPRKDVLRSQGLPAGETAFVLNEDDGSYAVLTEDQRLALVGGAVEAEAS